MELHVRACSARDLLDKQTFGKQDPYCKLTLRRKSFRTRVHDNGHKTPVWNQVFIFPVVDVQLDQLVLEVKDKNFTASTLIGECRLPVTMFIDGSVTDQWYTLHNGSKRAGEINLRVQLKGSGVQSKGTGVQPVPMASSTGKALQPPTAAQAYPYPQQSGYPTTQQYPSPYPVASCTVPAAAAATSASQQYPPQPYYEQQPHPPPYSQPPPPHYGQPPAHQYPGQPPAAQYPGQPPYYPSPPVATPAYGYPPPPAVAYAGGPPGMVGQGGYPSDHHQQHHGPSHGGFSVGNLLGHGGKSGHGGARGGAMGTAMGLGSLLGHGGKSGHGGSHGGGMDTAMGVGSLLGRGKSGHGGSSGHGGWRLNWCRQLTTTIPVM
uniref:C2 domain-containing protein n=1 Tax=Hyaloperonospora arabidopsidis (strain Emoy2) TaxID=559515 RepID=M4BBU3_HYAAE